MTTTTTTIRKLTAMLLADPPAPNPRPLLAEFRPPPAVHVGLNRIDLRRAYFHFHKGPRAANENRRLFGKMTCGKHSLLGLRRQRSLASYTISPCDGMERRFERCLPRTCRVHETTGPLYCATPRRKCVICKSFRILTKGFMRHVVDNGW